VLVYYLIGEYVTVSQFKIICVHVFQKECEIHIMNW